jgi:competence protein ComFC
MGYSPVLLKDSGGGRVAAINPQKIEGKGFSGMALDFHTLSSTPIGYNEFGHMQFDTKRPEIAELLYRLKYRGDQSVVPEIVATAASYLEPHRQLFDVIIPVPPSTARVVQSVIVMANGIGAAVGIPVVSCVTPTRATTQLKGVTDPEQRKQLLDGLYAVDTPQTAGKRILLFDDLFRSGSTMDAITGVLLQQGQAARVHAFTITRTRSNQ